MQVFKTIKETQQWCREQKKQGRTIGLVPTMGYLHEGHLTLVKKAREQCDIVVVSIFVNPIQFGAGEDFDQYPRDFGKDIALLEAEKTDLLFAPTASEMYTPGYNTFVEVSGEITGKLCGASRPGHFKGVTTVVSKLFNICLPDAAFFGQKDAQQAMVIEKMVKELNFPVVIMRVPIVREADGLALSSRNVYLNAEQRGQALSLNRALKMAQEEIRGGERNIEKLKANIRKTIEKGTEARIDYVEIYNAEDLSDADIINGKMIIALAVKVGTTRLIDNLLVEV